MRISNINNQQTNFKSWIVTKNGAVADLWVKDIHLGTRFLGCQFAQHGGYDFLVVPADKPALAGNVANELGQNLLMRTAITAENPGKSVQDLIDFWILGKK